MTFSIRSTSWSPRSRISERSCNTMTSTRPTNTGGCVPSRFSSTSVGICFGNGGRCARRVRTRIRLGCAPAIRSRAIWADGSRDGSRATRRHRRRRRSQRLGGGSLPRQGRTSGSGARTTRTSWWSSSFGACLRRRRCAVVAVFVSGQPVAPAHRRRPRREGSAGAPPLLVLHPRSGDRRPHRTAGGSGRYRSTPLGQAATRPASPSSTGAAAW